MHAGQHRRNIKFSPIFQLHFAIYVFIAGPILPRAGRCQPPHEQMQPAMHAYAKMGRAEAERLSDAFVRVANETAPAVVSICTIKIFSDADYGSNTDDQELRNARRGREYGFQIPRLFRQRGKGSGVLISPDGYIITNAHVIEHAQKISVKLTDHREFDGRIVGADHLTEVAVLKIEAKHLPFARLGNSDEVRVGEWVLAIGNPLELHSTVTAGIVSATGRQIDIIKDNFSVESFIQTDAAINPGNSGGALVNMRGEVIGINTAIATETGLGMGFGFAIPINLAKRISADLIRDGKIDRGYLGIAMLNIEDLQARALDLHAPMGVLVDDVFAGSPAEKQGLHPMDIILAIDGKEVNRTNQVQTLIARKKPGDKLNFKILREGQPSQLQITLGYSPEKRTVTPAHKSLPQFPNLGLKVQHLTRVDRIELGYKGEAGVLVTRIARFSPAEKAGLQVDDIIVAIDRKPVDSPEALTRAINSLHSGQVCILRVARPAGLFHYFVEIP